LKPFVTGDEERSFSGIVEFCSYIGVKLPSPLKVMRVVPCLAFTGHSSRFPRECSLTRDTKHLVTPPFFFFNLDFATWTRFAFGSQVRKLGQHVFVTLVEKLGTKHVSGHERLKTRLAGLETRREVVVARRDGAALRGVKARVVNCEACFL
jgi:hypothetical protein